MDKIEVRSTNAAVPHYLYDLSIPLPERQYKRMLFPSAIAVAAFLGVPPQRIYSNRASKHRVWSAAQGRWFAVRIANEKLQKT